MTEFHPEPAEGQWAIQTHNLTKQFPKQERFMGVLPPKVFAPPAVDAVSLAIRRGELFGLLGPNGAGKTTLIKMLATLILPTAGSASVCGYPLEDESAIKAAIGLVTADERSFYWRLTGRQNLAFFGALHGLTNAADRITETLTQAGLLAAADRPFKEYSTGMRQRLAIARALLHQPRVLFLDEPTRSLDPPAVRALHSLIREELVERAGLTVLLTTHGLAEAEKLCDRAAILHKGQVRGCGTFSELRGAIGETARYRVRTAQGKESAPPDDLLIPDDPATLNGVIDSLRRAGIPIESITREETPLEDVFDHLTADPLTAQPGALPLDEVTAIPASLRPPVSPSPRPPVPPSFLQLARAFLRLDWLSERSYKLAFLLSFGGIFFSVIVFYFVAQLLGEAASPYLAAYGGDYFAFVLVGIAFQRYFGVGLTGFAGTLRQAQTTGTLEAMLATPARLAHIVLASSLWRYGVTTLQVALYIGVGALFMGVQVNGNFPLALVVLLLAVVAFGSLGILAASFVMVLKRGDPITWAVGAASTFFGGVYFPVEVLPGWLQPVSAVLPATYALRAMRLALLQGAGWAQVGGDVLALAVFCAVLLPASLWMFAYAVRRAKVDGSLTHY